MEEAIQSKEGWQQLEATRGGGPHGGLRLKRPESKPKAPARSIGPFGPGAQAPGILEPGACHRGAPYSVWSNKGQDIVASAAAKREIEGNNHGYRQRHRHSNNQTERH